LAPKYFFNNFRKKIGEISVPAEKWKVNFGEFVVFADFLPSFIAHVKERFGVWVV
jgi:hypothetical protein